MGVIFLKLRLGLTKKVGVDLVRRVHTLHKTMHMHIFDKYYFLSKKTILVNPCLLPNQKDLEISGDGTNKEPNLLYFSQCSTHLEKHLEKRLKHTWCPLDSLILTIMMNVFFLPFALLFHQKNLKINMINHSYKVNCTSQIITQYNYKY